MSEGQGQTQTQGTAPAQTQGGEGQGSGAPAQQQAAQQQGAQTDYSLANGFLERVSPEHRAIVEPYVRQWDAGVTRRFQELHSQMAPYQELGAEPEQMQQALEIMEILNTNPWQIYGVLHENLLGQQPPWMQQPQGQPQQGQFPQGQYPQQQLPQGQYPQGQYPQQQFQQQAPQQGYPQQQGQMGQPQQVPPGGALGQFNPYGQLGPAGERLNTLEQMVTSLAQ